MTIKLLYFTTTPSGQNVVHGGELEHVGSKLKVHFCSGAFRCFSMKTWVIIHVNNGFHFSHMIVPESIHCWRLWDAAHQARWWTLMTNFLLDINCWLLIRPIGTLQLWLGRCFHIFFSAHKEEVSIWGHLRTDRGTAEDEMSISPSWFMLRFAL